MGLVESTLKTQSVKPLVRPDSSAPLPSFSLESAKFTDGRFGFVVTYVDIAKNTNISTYPVNNVIMKNNNEIIYSCEGDSIFSFTRDMITNRVFCFAQRSGMNTTVLRQCVTNYENLDNSSIDLIQTLYAKPQATSNVFTIDVNGS
jgi:hypothetical protein